MRLVILLAILAAATHQTFSRLNLLRAFDQNFADNHIHRRSVSTVAKFSLPAE